MSLKVPWPELSPEDRGRKVDELCAQVRAGVDVPREDLLKLLDYLDGTRAWLDATIKGWEKDSARMAGMIPPLGHPSFFPMPAQIRRRDGRSRSKKAPGALRRSS